jgi:hypothetical protein
MEEHAGKPLPVELVVLMKCTLPEEPDEDATVAGDDEQDSDAEEDAKVSLRLDAVDERLATLEGRFDGVQGKLDNLDAKLDVLIAALSALGVGGLKALQKEKAAEEATD